MRVVIDHIAGARRGQRQVFPAPSPTGGRLRFGRHPECEVAFDSHRDIDASARHAELQSATAGWLLVDLGSSNGTYVAGQRVTEAPVGQNVALDLEFGPGGPRVRLFVGDDAAIARLPRVALARTWPKWLGPALAGAAIAVAVVALLVRC